MTKLVYLFLLRLIGLSRRIQTVLLFFSCDSPKDFKEFADAVETIKDNGVVVAVASIDDVEAANKENPVFPEVKKCL